MVEEIRGKELEVQEVEHEQTMEEMMQEFDAAEIHRGKIVEGTVVDAREDDGWLVDVGYKCEGFLPRKEWTHKVLVGARQSHRWGIRSAFR